jgi:hypothetical protein
MPFAWDRISFIDVYTSINFYFAMDLFLGRVIKYSIPYKRLQIELAIGQSMADMKIWSISEIVNYY